jgi:hypothetical protein
VRRSSRAKAACPRPAVGVRANAAAPDPPGWARELGQRVRARASLPAGLRNRQSSDSHSQSGRPGRQEEAGGARFRGQACVVRGTGTTGARRGGASRDPASPPPPLPLAPAHASLEHPQAMRGGGPPCADLARWLGVRWGRGRSGGQALAGVAWPRARPGLGPAAGSAPQVWGQREVHPTKGARGPGTREARRRAVLPFDTGPGCGAGHWSEGPARAVREGEGASEACRRGEGRRMRG